MTAFRFWLPPALLLASLSVWAASPVVVGRGGAVATISEPASRAAMSILDAGGNAVDAAVAAAATLGVTDPFSCGIGGGGFMLIYSAHDDKVIAIDHRETAPAYYGPTVLMEHGQPRPFADVVPTPLSVGVPGTVRGWHEALSRYGSMTLAQVLAPAIGVAEQGFAVGANFHRINSENEAKFARYASAQALFLRHGKALPIGSRFRNPDLARTYRELADGGVAAFYQGAIAADIVRAVNQPPLAAGVRIRGVPMTLADLREYEVRLRQPVRSTYRGYTLYGMPLPSAGGIAVAEALNMLETFDLAAMPRAEAEHRYLEASRLAFADRNAYIGDGEFVDVPVAGLLSKAYARERARQIGPSVPQAPVAAGDPYPYQHDPSPSRALAPPVVAVEPAHTTHLAVSDRGGNIVAYTFTIESWGGSGIVVPGRGFLLNNEMTDFDFSGPHANVPEAGKRPRSSMSPTIVFRDGRPAFTIGSPGGATIVTTVLQTVFNHIDLRMPLAAALAAPRLSQRNGGPTEVETLTGFPGSAQAVALERYGHRWKPVAQIGAANGIAFLPDGRVEAVSEPLRHGGGSALVQHPD